MRLNQVTLGSRDLARAIPFYQKLGLLLIVDSRPRYARFELPDSGDTFSLHHRDTLPENSRALIYFECDDLDARVARLLADGIKIDSGPQDESWLWREARLRDPDDNPICLFSAGQARRYPPWRISGESLD